jgi:selenocysteine lyase/cysteine desulfurase
VLKDHFGNFFAADPGRLHFAAHSHHPWPDATRAAQLRYWEDSAALVDRKWERIFGDVVPRAQDHVARLLGLSDARQVAFAPNTHEFVARLFSCLDRDGPPHVLSSAHEFHSFRRQARRLAEDGRIVLHEVAAAPFDSFVERFVAAVRGAHWDLVFASHAHFDTGFVVGGLEAICAAAPDDALVAIDGYHAFCALPVDLTQVHRRAFYIAGGYKYAMSGEGACFLAVPPGCDARPANTGWFAAFDSLSDAPGARVRYGDGAFRFWGSTFDASGLYRFNAAMDWLAATGTTIAHVHAHARSLQERFLARLDALDSPRLARRDLALPAAAARGNFLAFDVDDAAALEARITQAGVAIDRRERRLRFGFGVYHEAADVDRLAEALRPVLR